MTEAPQTPSLKKQKSYSNALSRLPATEFSRSMTQVELREKLDKGIQDMFKKKAANGL